MISVYRGSDYFEAQLLTGLMEQEGLRVFLQGAALQGGMGDLPALGHLSITVNDADQARAEEIIAAYENGDYSLDELKRYAEALEEKIEELPEISKVDIRGVMDKEVEIGPTEFKLLELFMRNPDRAFDRSQLLDRVWGRGVYVEERTVDVHVLRLRKVLKPLSHHHLLETVRGVGYRLSSKHKQ